jgi:hypothetical protein
MARFALQLAIHRVGQSDMAHPPALSTYSSRCYHTAYTWDDRPSLSPYATIGVPVISRHIWNLWAISWRYSEAGNRGRRGRKCWAIGP